MTRLTRRLDDKSVMVIGNATIYNSITCNGKLNNAILRLGEYEDTGLTPNEIKRLIEETSSVFNG